MSERKKGRRWRTVRAQVLASSNICWLCGQPGADSIDHVVPISLGGHMTDLANLRPAHLLCNIRRGNGSPSKVRRTPTSRKW